MLGHKGLDPVLAPGALALAPTHSGARRLPGRDKVMLAGPDQVGTPHTLQRFAQQRPILGIVITQESLVQATLADALGGKNSIAVRAADRLAGGASPC